jgi:CRP-like cAMP-binding protein
MAKNARKLREAAQKAADKGKWNKAVEAYLEIEKLEPNDGQWSRRVADCYRRLGQESNEVIALMRAVERYSRAGFLVKAIAMCKMILAIDPEHTASQQALAEFSAARGIPLAAKKPEPPPVPPPAIQRSRSIPPGAQSLDEIELNVIVPGAKDIGGASDVHSGVFEIPLDESDLILDDAIADIEIEMDEPATVADAATEAAAEAAAEVFPKTPLFSDLGHESLASLITKVDLVTLDKGSVLFKQGDESDALYVVADGAVAVIDEGPPRVQLTRIDEGGFFGEIGLMTSAPRRATVEAAEDSQVLRINLDVIGDLVEHQPRVLKVLLRFLRDRLIDNLVHTSPLFEPFIGGERDSLASRFRFLEVERDAVLIRQDERAEGLFVLLSGRVEVVRAVDGEERRLATLDFGDLFGEMSLLTHEPAVATVRTTSKCFALELPGNVFREIIMTHPQVLMFVGDLADQRRRENAAIIDGTADYTEGHLELV